MEGLVTHVLRVQSKEARKKVKENNALWLCGSGKKQIEKVPTSVPCAAVKLAWVSCMPSLFWKLRRAPGPLGSWLNPLGLADYVYYSQLHSYQFVLIGCKYLRNSGNDYIYNSEMVVYVYP